MNLESVPNENSILVEHSLVYNVIRDGNGGFVYCNKEYFSISMIYSSFTSCHVKESSYNGGAVYFSSTNGKFSMKRIYSCDCSSYEGHFVFITDSNEANSCIDLVSTEHTYGDYRGCILLYKSLLEVNSYNTSYCNSNIHCNIHVEQCSSDTKVRHSNFYQCHSDILCSVDSLVDYNNCHCSYANFIENAKSNGEYGFIHTNSIDSFILYCDQICFYNNSHTLICGLKGTVKIENLYCDNLIGIGNYEISKSFQPTKPVITEFIIFNKICITHIQFNNQKLLSITKNYLMILLIA